jgi:hypothetical protein
MEKKASKFGAGKVSCQRRISINNTHPSISAAMKANTAPATSQ